jgi:hypothetical protein
LHLGPILKGHFPKLNAKASNGKYIGGWNLIDYEMNHTQSRCYSGHYAAVGSVATLYSRGVVPLILAWLEDEPHLPFDHVFGHLSHIGAPVRVAQPNLCIAELDKVSGLQV